MIQQMGGTRFLLAISACAVATSAFAEEITYTYDARGRLVGTKRSSLLGDGPRTVIEYDAAGNRTRYAVSDSDLPPPTPALAVTNGSFEQPQLAWGQFVYAPRASGYEFSGAAGIANDGSPWSFASAPDGDQVGFLQSSPGGGGRIRLALTGLTPGASYAIEFRHAFRPAYGPTPVTVTAGGAVLGTYTAASPDFAPVTTPSFEARTNSTIVEFSSQPTAAERASGIDLVLVTQTAAALPRVIGGTYEAPEVGAGFAYGPSVDGVGFSGGGGIAGDGSPWYAAPARDGNQAGFLQGGASITHRLSALTPGAAYAITFHVAQRPGYGGNPLAVSVDGETIGAVTPQSTAFTPFTTATFIARGAEAQLRFLSQTSPSDIASAVDSVTIAEMAGAVPRVAEGSYEVPEVGTGFVYSPSRAGLSFVHGAGIAGNGSAWSFAAAPDGDQAAFLQSGTGLGGTIRHDLTGLTPGASYVISFQTARRPGYSPNPITLRVGTTNLGTFAPPSGAFTRFTSGAFRARSATETLQFETAPSNVDLASGIDDVEIALSATDPATVLDASFEAPQVADFVYSPSAEGLTFQGGAGITRNGGSFGFAAAPHGNQVAFLQSSSVGSGSIRQTVTGLGPGATYAVTFMLARRPNSGVNSITVRHNGVSLGTFTPPSNGFTTFTSAAFRAASSTDTIEFIGNPSAVDSASALDKVSVVQGE